MRVTNASTYRNYTSQINDVHANLNKSFNKISSGKAYEAAADSPLSYYRGKEIDNQYLEIYSKSKLLTDVQNRLYQQELGVYDIQKKLSSDTGNSNARSDILRLRTATTNDTAKATIRDDLLQIEHNIVNDLNSQYQDFYVYGGNDASTPPFSLSADGRTFSYTHTFPGEDGNPTTFTMNLEKNADGKYAFTFSGATQQDGKVKLDKDDAESKLIKALSEQGYMDLGYGDIRFRDTLIDTYTGGMNVLTGIKSDAIIADQKKADPQMDLDYIMDKLTSGPLGLVAQAVRVTDAHLDPDEEADLYNYLGDVLSQLPDTEHTVSTFYSDLGNKYKLLDDLEGKLNDSMDSLTEQYKDIMGADPYASIMEMFNNQYSYNAALQVGSQLMSSSLFDFVR